MTSIRQSICYSLEDSFGKGKGANKYWLAPPPGSYFTSTHNRQASRIQSTGSKTFDTFAYGTLQGSWEWTFMLDYEYLEPLNLVFEKCTKTTVSAETYEYTFSKENNFRVPSFCVRRVVLNSMANSSRTNIDEVVELRGCVCKSITFSRSAGSSQMQVSMSGFYADEQMVLGNWNMTDFRQYAGNLVEYACLFIGDYTVDTNYVANTESLTVSIDNSAEAVYNTCTPFAKEYYEGLTTYSFSTTAYSNDPDHYKRRVYTGGHALADMPLSKGLAPVNLMHILSYNAEVDRFDNNTPNTYASQSDAYANADKSLDIEITKCVLRSLQWQNGDGSKLQDSISSAECQKITFKFRTDRVTVGFDTNNNHKIENPVGSS